MTVAMDPKIACIGAGYWGKNLVGNFHALGRLSCVCETSPGRQADLSAQYPGARLTDSLEPILSDPEVAAVAIATPAETHGELVLQACQQRLERGSNGAALKPSPQTLPYFAHESAFIDEEMEIGEGTTIWHVSHILKGSRIGKDCRIGQNVVIGPNVTSGNNVKIQNNVSVYEGVALEDHVFCGPSMVFTNVFNPRSEIRRMEELRSTLVRRGASLGANCAWSAA